MGPYGPEISPKIYENPRKITKKELSEITEIPRSTLQEHLSKAEAALVEWAVKTHLSK